MICNHSLMLGIHQVKYWLYVISCERKKENKTLDKTIEHEYKELDKLVLRKLPA